MQTSGAATAQRERAALELLHPDGVGRSAADVIVVREATASAAGLLRDRLTADGVAYLKLGPARRAALARAAGLELGPAVVEVAGMLVPVQRDALRWALARTATVRGRVGRFAPLRALAMLGSGAIARRPGARPLGNWLHARGNGTAVVAGRRTAFLVDRDGLALVAKIGTGLAARRALTEAAALADLGPEARRAGAQVPVALEDGRLDGAPLLVTTGIQGAPASALIAARPQRRVRLIERLAEWLERWNVATAIDGVLSAELLECELLAPARKLGLPERHVAELGRLCSRLVGRPVKLVAAHNDLTTANVLVDRNDGLGIVDWETAERRTLPLGDLFYALGDAEAAVTGFVDRPQAVVALAAAEGVELESRFVATLGLDQRVADVCFHACWLRHAANESRREGGGERPFLQIVRTISERQVRLGAVA